MSDQETSTAERRWGICSTCQRHRPISHKIGESPHHQWCCVDCAQPTKAEIEALKSRGGRVMPKHTTHFHDCGCKSAEYEAQIADLKAEVGRLRQGLFDLSNLGCVSGASLGDAIDISNEILERLPEDWELWDEKVARRAKIEVLEELIPHIIEEVECDCGMHPIRCCRMNRGGCYGARAYKMLIKLKAEEG